VLFGDFFNKSSIKYYAELLENCFIILILVLIGYGTKLLGWEGIIDGWVKWVGKAMFIGCITALFACVIYRKSDGIQFLKNKLKK
jgi:ABC-type transporter Mla maintaining outer membrane lipid asymmetry permease subunit MlaE